MSMNYDNGKQNRDDHKGKDRAAKWIKWIGKALAGAAAVATAVFGAKKMDDSFKHNNKNQKG